MDAFTKHVRKAARSVMPEAGKALHEAQSLEFAVGLLTLHLDRLSGGSNVVKLVDILENKEKKTLGQLIRLLKPYLEVDAELDEIFNKALDSRNYVVHRILIEHVEQLTVSGGADLLIKLIRHHRATMRKAELQIRPLIEELDRLLDGFDRDEFETKVRRRFGSEANNSFKPKPLRGSA